MARSPSLFLIGVFQILAGPPPVFAQFDPNQCSNFAALNFSVGAFDRYTTFFNENSTLVVAQAGSYQGPADIEEYVRFSADDSPYILVQSNIGRAQFSPSVDFATEECIFRLAEANYYEANPATSSGGSYSIAFGAKVFYSPRENIVTRMHVFFSAPSIEFVYGTSLNSPQTRKFVCGVLADSVSCSDVRAINDINEAECLTRLAALDFFDGTMAYIDGNTQGCRVLHAVFALTNPGHCPHISFTPVEDDNGNFKCQTSENIDVLDLFTAEDIVLFEEFCANVPEIATTDCYKVLSAEMTVDFSNYGVGDGIEALDHGIRVTAFKRQWKGGALVGATAMILDSENPSDWEKDLGTPNQDFGGIGVGQGGRKGQPFENAKSQGKVLIISQDDRVASPNDHAFGGYIIFSFDSPMALKEIGLLDNEESAQFDVQQRNGVTQSTLSEGGGDNSFEAVSLGDLVATQLKVTFGGSGAIAYLKLGPEMGPV